MLRGTLETREKKAPWKQPAVEGSVTGAKGHLGERLGKLDLVSFSSRGSRRLYPEFFQVGGSVPSLFEVLWAWSQSGTKYT